MGKMLGDKYPEDKRLVFDTITEQFDEWRERYSEELFEYIKTNADLITIKDSSRDAFFSGIRDAIMKHGNKIVVGATYVLDLYQKNIN